MEDDIYMEFSAHARGHIEIEQTLPAKKKEKKLNKHYYTHRNFECI
jgi:hypothetical protein